MRLTWVFRLAPTLFVVATNSCFTALMLLLQLPVLVGLGIFGALFWWKVGQYPRQEVTAAAVFISVLWLLWFAVALGRAIRRGNAAMRVLEKAEYAVIDSKLDWLDKQEEERQERAKRFKRDTTYYRASDYRPRQHRHANRTIKRRK